MCQDGHDDPGGVAALPGATYPVVSHTLCIEAFGQTATQLVSNSAHLSDSFSNGGVLHRGGERNEVADPFDSGSERKEVLKWFSDWADSLPKQAPPGRNENRALSTHATIQPVLAVKG